MDREEKKNVYIHLTMALSVVEIVALVFMYQLVGMVIIILLAEKPQEVDFWGVTRISECLRPNFQNFCDQVPIIFYMNMISAVGISTSFLAWIGAIKQKGWMLWPKIIECCATISLFLYVTLSSKGRMGTNWELTILMTAFFISILLTLVIRMHIYVSTCKCLKKETIVDANDYDAPIEEKKCQI
ncbi:uncharacterized protein LOC132193879 [Neocloeon triangulifer]|uniref:uncharacterized protein LOC132193879 n=1 Tax=Neocloeon triangulifer TaxID=2078957 RepID=UPI00286FA69E|nr:uncharacterized protein LOC132193879 [Neocloeon triangulifer]